jgi:uncharacterized membrane protein
MLQREEAAMSSPASIKRHPIHPMLIPLPIGLWVFSFISDIIYRAGGGAVWNEVAFYTMAGGIVGALLAAIPGFIDYRAIRESRLKSVGRWHMSLNLATVVLFTFNLWLRTQSPPGAGWPFALSIIGIAVLGVSGWLGGTMVYEYGMAVSKEHEEPRRKAA